MKLIDYRLYPTVVVDADDTEKVSKIRCHVPGLFDPEAPTEALPWIHPFNMSGYQSFNKMRPNMHVWVIQNTINPSELWYIPMPDYIDVSDELIKEHFDDDLQILLSRKTLEGAGQIYYNDKEGIVLRVNDTRLQISPDGKIIIGNGNHMLNLLGDSASIGSTSEGFQPGVKGNNLINAFSDMSKAIQKVIDACTGQELPALKMPLLNLKDVLDGIQQKYGILAKNTKFN